MRNPAFVDERAEPDRIGIEPEPELTSWLDGDGAGADRFAVLEAFYDAARGCAGTQVRVDPVLVALGYDLGVGRAIVGWLVAQALLRQSFGPSHVDLTALGAEFVQATRR